MTDEKIIELYFERSEKALEETERAYDRYLYSISLGILSDVSDAEEIVNDTYLKAWNSIPPEKPRSLKSFLAMITRSLSLNRLEYRHAQKRSGNQYSLALDELSECIANSESEDDSSSLGELSELINRFLHSLPTEPRRIFIRRYWYLERVCDSAQSYHISESKVKSILHRTRKKLKTELVKEGFNI